MLDQIFGENNFQNEIIWKRTIAHSDAQSDYGPIHDVDFLLLRRLGRVHMESSSTSHMTLSTWRLSIEHDDPDGRRWMRMDLTGDGVRHGESGEPWREIDVTSKGRHWAIPKDAAELYGAIGQDKPGKARRARQGWCDSLAEEGTAFRD